MDQQLRHIAECGQGDILVKDDHLYELFTSGFPLRELAHQYVDAEKSIREYIKNGGKYAFEIVSGGAKSGKPAIAPLFSYPWIINTMGLSQNLVFFSSKSLKDSWLVVQFICINKEILGQLIHIPICAQYHPPADALMLLLRSDDNGNTPVDPNGSKISPDELMKRFWI